MAKVDVNAPRAALLLQTLQHQKQIAGEYPLTADRLRQLSDATISDTDLLAALAHKSIAGQIVVAAKKDVASPVALVEDEMLLVGSDLLLRFALGKLATAEAPLHPIKKLLGKIEARLRPAFEASLIERLSAKTLPAGVGLREVAKKPNLYLDQFPPPPPPRSPAEQLADSLLARLRELHQQGMQVVVLTDLLLGKVSPGALKAALTREPFATAAVVVPVSNKVQLVGLERGAMLASDRLLTALLQAHTSTKKPGIRPDALAELLPETDRDDFRAGLRARLSAGRLPQGVVVRQVGDDVELVLENNLPAAQRLASKLLELLRVARQEGPASYPARLADLFARIEIEPGSKLAKVVLAEKSFSAGTVVALPGQPGSPIALAEDQNTLLRAPNFIPLVLQAMRSDDNQAVALSDLGKKVVPDLQPGFAALVEQQVAEGRLPASVGCLRIKKKPHLFLLADAAAKPTAALAPTPVPKPATAPVPAPAIPAPIDFARMFDAAFARLDQERGSHNLVSLVQLRQEVPLARDRFDSELIGLRRAGRYSLVSAEGRHGLSEDERTAGIVEHGNLLLFVSRRQE